MMLGHAAPHEVAPERDASERALVLEIVGELDRVAFIPLDVVRAHAAGRVGADVFDRYRPSGDVPATVWRGVIAELCARALATAH